jgi:small subunit ribosomal protein S20
MAHTEHAKKTHRQSEKRKERNRAMRSNIKGAVKSVRAAVPADDKATVATLASAAARLDKAAKARVIHPNKASRLKSRLAKALARARAAGAAAPAKS